MIDEKKLIDELKQSGMIADNEYGNAIVDMIENQPKIGEWIPCNSGKMPHPGSAVLIQLRRRTDGITGDTGRSFDISFLRTSKNEWVSSCGTYPFEDVVAWQPLPEPYHKEN